MAMHRQRRGRHQLRGLVCFAVVALVAVVALATLGTGARIARAAGSCPEVRFIGARGSGEPAGAHRGLGADVDIMATALQGALAKEGVSMEVRDVPYPADSTGDLVPSPKELALLLHHTAQAVALYGKDNVGKFLASINDGTRIVVADVKETFNDCPATGIILAGYSQGAIAVHQAELKLAGRRGPLGNHIAGTLLVADGERVPDTAAAERLGTAPNGEGVLPHFVKSFVRDVPLPASTADICNAYDIVCDTKVSDLAHSGVRVHTSYDKDGGPLLKRAAGWLANLLRPAPRITITTAELPQVHECERIEIPIEVTPPEPPRGRFWAGVYIPGTTNLEGMQLVNVDAGFLKGGGAIPPGTYTVGVYVWEYERPLSLPSVVEAERGPNYSERIYTLRVLPNENPEITC